MPTENSVRINPHSCGRLIAELVDALMHFPCWQAQAFRHFRSRKANVDATDLTRLSGVSLISVV